MHMPSMRACAHVRMHAWDTWKTMGLERRRPASYVPMITCAHVCMRYLEDDGLGEAKAGVLCPCRGVDPRGANRSFNDDRVHLSRLQLSTCTYVSCVSMRPVCVLCYVSCR